MTGVQTCALPIWLSTKTNRIGYIAAKPIGLVLRNVNYFTVGMKKVNPAAEVQLIITGDWSLPVREAESAQALIDTGCDVIACHVDSPKVVIETAESRGVKTLGHNADRSSLAPKGFITGLRRSGARSTTPMPSRSPKARSCRTSTRADMTRIWS